MSAQLSRARARAHALAGLVALAAIASAPAPARAQQAPESIVAGPAAAGPSWLERVSIAARVGSLRPAGRSELFALLDRALVPGTRALRPTLVGGALHVRVTPAWGLLLGVETGGSTVASVSRVQPGSAPREVAQRTNLELTAVQYLGAEWQALRWRGGGADAADRLRLVLGAGAGVAHYRLRQWGEFVDEDRGVAFQDDLRSGGRGTVGHLTAAVEVPLLPWAALRGELRRQAGSAPMSADYAGFDRLDLGGTSFGAGLRIHPAGRGGRR